MSVITIMEEEVYDSLSQANKHIMLKNGGFEFDAKQSSYCCCGHSNSDHLDYVDCCLNKEPCICDRFLDRDSKKTISDQKQGKLPYEEELLQKQKGKEEIEDSQLAGYIQTLAKM